jgi:hypothetical protein
MSIPDPSTYSVKELLTSPELNNQRTTQLNIDLWKNKINAMGYIDFYDEYFRILKEHHDEYLNYEWVKNMPPYWGGAYSHPDPKKCIYLEKYLSEKTGIEIADQRIHVTDILEYIYNGALLTLEAKSEGLEPEDTLEVNGKTYEYRYFLWIKNDDPNLIPANSEEIITTQNFLNHKLALFDGGWSLLQLKTFVITNILPIILQKAQLNLNIEHPAYKKCISSTFKGKRDLSGLIINFIKTNLDHYDPNTNYNSRDLYAIYNRFIRCLKFQQEKVRSKLHKRFRKIAERQQPKIISRFKWMNVCSVFNQMDDEDLYEFAAAERIPYANMMSKREICAELAKKMQERITSVNKLKAQCSNEDSIFTMEPVKDISPEFFYAYKHNNQVYCDDIRDLVTHFRTRGNRHPIDRTPVPPKLVNLIMNEYKYLESITNTMKDLNGSPEEIISPQSVLTSKATNFTSLLNYPNPTDLFINSDSTLFREFINSLIQEHILSNNEYRNIYAGRDLLDQKTRFLDIITLKIMNDPNQIQTPTGTLSQLSINTSHVYNETFIPEQSEISEPTESEMPQLRRSDAIMNINEFAEEE